METQISRGKVRYVFIRVFSRSPVFCAQWLDQYLVGPIIVARSATESGKQMEIGGAPYDPPGGYSQSKKSISSGGLLLIFSSISPKLKAIQFNLNTFRF